MQLFLGLALACFVIITTLKYANPIARQEVADTLSGAPSGASDGQADPNERRDGVNMKKTEIPGR